MVKSKKLDLKNSDVRFRFIIFNKNEDIENAEKWLIWKLASDNRKLLNEEKINIEPNIVENIKEKASSLLARLNTEIRLCQVQ